jgi:GT2 family glycosyltransferase
MNKHVTIVIPVVTARYLPECLTSIERCTTDIPYEIILVNDGSGEPELLNFLHSTPYRVVTLETNRGFAVACNAGFRAAIGASPYLMTLNADTEVTTGWLGKLVPLLEVDPDLAAVGPVVLDYPAATSSTLPLFHSSTPLPERENGRKRAGIDPVGRWRRWKRKNHPSSPSNGAEREGNGRIQQAGCTWDGSGFHTDLVGIDTSTIPYVPTRYCDAIGGMCMLFRRDPLFDVGLFDEVYRNSCEDMAICLTLRERGHRIAVSGESFIYHRGGVSRHDSTLTNLDASHLYFVTTWTPDRITSLPPATATRTINLIGAFTDPWRAEHHVASALEALGFRVNRFDHRAGEADRATTTPADLTLVLKGDDIPPDLITHFPKPTILWYGELLHRPDETPDEISSAKLGSLAQNVRAFDMVAHHDNTALQTIRNLGANRVVWVSNSGVNPTLHRKLGIETQYDVGFFGFLSPRRQEILDTLQAQGIPVVYRRAWGDDLNHFINECRICLNIHYTDLLNTETRLHEILGAGTFCLSEEISMPEMYTDGQHLVYWKHGEIDDLSTKIRQYLDHPDERERVASTGHRMVHERYTYTHRCRSLLSLVTYHFRYLSNYHLGIPLDKDGYPTLDINEFEKAIELIVSPEYPYAHYHRGNLALRYGDATNAVLSYRQALTLNPALDEARYSLALALFHTGEDDEAVIHFSALPADRYPDALKLMAILYRRLSRPDDAIRCLEEYLHLHPGAPDAGSLREEMERLRSGELFP